MEPWILVDRFAALAQTLRFGLVKAAERLLPKRPRRHVFTPFYSVRWSLIGLLFYLCLPIGQGWPSPVSHSGLPDLG
jgi:hypothetical protein